VEQPQRGKITWSNLRGLPNVGKKGRDLWSIVGSGSRKKRCDCPKKRGEQQETVFLGWAARGSSGSENPRGGGINGVDGGVVSKRSRNRYPSMRTRKSRKGEGGGTRREISVTFSLGRGSKGKL